MPSVACSAAGADDARRSRRSLSTHRQNMDSQVLRSTSIREFTGTIARLLGRQHSCGTSNQGYLKAIREPVAELLEQLEQKLSVQRTVLAHTILDATDFD